ncbi:MAG: ribosome small subunit-dependent GTPase A [Anaerolineales bacterium]|nr:ribosome small subunit-dependent GTPase A [Anaerolineales bacterium]
MTELDLIPGMILRAQSGFFDVETEKGVVIAQLRGRLTQGRQETDAAAVGDRVWVQLLEDDKGTIEAVDERTRVLSRSAPGRQEVEQVLIANPDQAVFVFACAEPDPNFRMLDRLLVVAEREQIPAIICANKIDLVRPRSAKAEFGEYDRLGYKVIYTSAKTGKGVRTLRKVLKDKLSVLTGPSGAGKSSLLNAVQPGLGLRTKRVSEATGKGQHATVFPELIPLEIGGYVADTPGLKAFALWDIEPEELDGYFPEMRDLVADCEFSDCTHIHEPGCAVIAAVEQGKISPERYDSYMRMRLGEPD